MDSPRPAISIRTSRFASAWGLDALSPARFPWPVDWDFSELSGDQVSESSIRLQFKLRSGMHAVRFTRDFSLDIDIADGSSASVELVTGRARPPVSGGAAGQDPEGSPGAAGDGTDQAGCSVVDLVSVSFDSPLVIRNVFGAVRGAHTLFDNIEVKEFLNRLLAVTGRFAVDLESAASAASERFVLVRKLFDQAAGRVPEVADMARKGFDRLGSAFAARLGEPVSLEISAVSFRLAPAPDWAGSDCPILVPSITGSFVLSHTGARARFEDIEVPSILLPRFNSNLTDLLKGNVMVGGAFKKQAVGVSNLMLDVAGMLGAFQGTIDATVALPALRTSWRQADRSDVVAELWTGSSQAKIHAAFQVAKEGDDAVFDVSQLSIGEPDSRRSFKLQAGLTVFGLFRDGLSMPTAVRGTLRQTNRGSLPVTYLRLEGRNPLLKSGNAMIMRIDELKTGGRVDFGFSASGNPVFELPDRDFVLQSVFSVPDQCFGPAGTIDLFGAIRRGNLKACVTAVPGSGFDVQLSGCFPAAFKIQTDLRHVPELDIEPGRLEISGSGTVTAELGVGVAMPAMKASAISFSPRGKVGLTLAHLQVRDPQRKVKALSPITIGGTVREGVIAADGDGDVGLDLEWRLETPRIEICSDRCRQVSDLPLRMMTGRQTVRVSPGGRISLAGNEGSLVRPDLLKALASPFNNAGTILELLDDDELVYGSLDSLAQLAALFNRPVADRLVAVRDWIIGVRSHARAVGVAKPGDLLDMAVLSRLVSRIIVGDESISDELRPLLSSLGDGQGFDDKAARMLMIRHRPDITDTYEFDLIVSWIGILTTPVDHYNRAVPVNLPPVSDDPSVAAAIRDIPAASTLYKWFSGGEPAQDKVETVVRLAPMMFIEQLEYVLSGMKGTAFNQERAMLQYALSAKRAISRAVNPGELANMYIVPRASVIAGFLGDIIGPIPGIDGPGAEVPPPAPLGPRDIAEILEIGLGSQVQGVQTQLNNRLAIEFLKQKDGDFLAAVFSEMARDVPMTMAIHLMAFFRHEQGRLKDSFDPVAFFEQKTGLKAPRFEDYQAGGRRARQSYFQALDELAVRVMQKSAGYRAVKNRLREAAEPPRKPRVYKAAIETSTRVAGELIDSADAATRKWLERSRPTSTERDRCIAAWDSAFMACREALKADPWAFHQPWFKQIWQRSEQAVRVASVVRGFQADLDDVRPWLTHFDGSGIAATCPTGQLGHARQQQLVDAAIGAIWAYPDDRARIASDPLARLLMWQEDGNWDLTIVSAMGVITDGAYGREMAPAFDRLLSTRGISLRRVPTGLFRTLEFNARAIISEVRQVQGPWAWLGYSQGCANCLRAEHIMMTGTPELRALADRIACRQMIFSAANGSVHATAGARLFTRMLIEGEKSLKHYQAVFSREFVSMFLKTGRGVLDSRVSTALLAGLWSMTFDRAIDLHRDGVFAPGVPTSTIRAAVGWNELPDGLRYVFGMHNRLMPGEDCDSQVATLDEVGHSTRVINARTAVLESCDMGSAAIRMHHWGPVHEEAAQGMTRDDVALHKYDSPADLYIFPWIDTCIRFGFIKPSER
ncbi:MAG TPA: hypothetical protein PLB35_05825 [Myxococcota bacterium]|nr:hypothetical protein [Myxococcota bacterium]HOH76755.1 hypothetical protein [Myxococcota bacterium]